MIVDSSSIMLDGLSKLYLLKHLISVPFGTLVTHSSLERLRPCVHFVLCKCLPKCEKQFRVVTFTKVFFFFFLNYKKYKVVGLGLPYLKHMILWVTKIGSKIFLWMVANVATPQR